MSIHIDDDKGYTEEELQETITVTREELLAFEDDLNLVTVKWREKAGRIGEFTKPKYTK